jgi:hypothetical protein
MNVNFEPKAQNYLNLEFIITNYKLNAKSDSGLKVKKSKGGTNEFKSGRINGGLESGAKGFPDVGEERGSGFKTSRL